MNVHRVPSPKGLQSASQGVQPLVDLKCRLWARSAVGLCAFAIGVLWPHASTSLAACDAIEALAALFVVALTVAVWPVLWARAVHGGSAVWRAISAENVKDIAATSTAQWAILGALRFVLAGIVAMIHLPLVCPTRFSANAAGSLAAVMGFFLISGYSISNALDRSDMVTYLRRRWIRIFPLYLTLSLATLVMARFIGPCYDGHQIGSTVTVAANLVMLQGFFGIEVNGYLTPAWTLSLEWWYYIVAPALARLRPAIFFLLLGSAIAWTLHHSFWTATDWTSSRWLGFAWAWLLGFALHRYTSPILRVVATVAPIMLMLQPFDIHPGETYGPTTIAVVAAILVNLRSLKLPTYLIKAAAWLGEISYPLYLCHWPTYIILGSVWRTLPGALHHSYTCVAIAILGAAILYYTVDVPFRFAKRALSWQRAAISAT